MTFVGVCGGRNLTDSRFVRDVLNDHVRLDDVVVHGDCEGGADRLANAWAIEHGRHVVRVPAQWKQRGRGAGPQRNAVIAALPLRLLIAFPGGSGTADMVKQARASGVDVLEVTR